MPKFNKDQIQKMFLGGILFVFLIYSYFNFLLGPLKTREVADRRAITELETAISTATQQIRRGNNADANAVGAVDTMKRINKMIPPEPPITWLPPLFVDYFAKQGVERVVVRPVRSEPVGGEGLAGFKYYVWNVEVPEAPLIKVADILTKMENKHPLLSIRSINIDGETGNPETQRINFEIKTILK